MKLITTVAIIGLAPFAFATPTSRGFGDEPSWLASLNLPTQGTFEFTVCCDTATTVTTNIPGACSAIGKGAANAGNPCNGEAQYNCYFEDGKIVSPFPFSLFSPSRKEM
jgi:hypothetical protein